MKYILMQLDICMGFGVTLHKLLCGKAMTDFILPSGDIICLNCTAVQMDTTNGQ